MLVGAVTFDSTTGVFSPTQASSTYVVVNLPQLGGGPDASVLFVKSLDSAATLRIVGTRAVIIASDSTIAIAGSIDAGSTLSGFRGPDANASPCNAAGAGGASGDGGGGGGGGFGSSGGAGGTGDNTGAANAGAKGTSILPPAWVRGGCAGAGGLHANSGVAGASGGGLELAARNSVMVAGRINAGGGAGGGAPGQKGGGGGGGSGGMIGLDAPMVTILSGAVLAANGGGAGGGADGAGSASAGADATTAAVAGGGTGPNALGGSGASGGSSATAGGNGLGSGGGGGGGGGVGYIVVHGALTTAGTTSPAVTLQ